MHKARNSLPLLTEERFCELAGILQSMYGLADKNEDIIAAVLSVAMALDLHNYIAFEALKLQREAVQQESESDNG